LALRALIRERLTAEPFSLILLTTFDTSTRIIAHQDIHIDVVVRQARHLKISLVGVPLHRTTSETYEHRIRRALNAIEDRVGKKPFSLVFGDLHLDHIRHWRDVSLGLEWRLEYPLWQVPYETLLSEIEHCGVKFVISASERAEVKIGTEFTREYSNWISKCTNIDGMGESGEFHTVAQVWVVDRERALGISNP
jgi:diphthamide synthase (EF-2-diphthine--ammonia ligase)